MNDADLEVIGGMPPGAAAVAAAEMRDPAAAKSWLEQHGFGACTVADYIWDEPHGWPVAAHDDPGLTPCGEPAIALLTFACIHEHVDGAFACAACAAEIQRVADLLVCQHCEDGPQSHECKQTLGVKWLT